jgi:hypothetical protein
MKSSDETNSLRAKTGARLEKLGTITAALGGLALAAIFAAVIVNGSWPPSLHLIRDLFARIGDAVGDAAIVAEGLLFVGPGLLVRRIGSSLRR